MDLPKTRYLRCYAGGRFFSVENPEIVFVCILENAGGGGSIAGGMTKRFLDKYLEIYKGIEAPKQEIIDSTPKLSNETKKKQNSNIENTNEESLEEIIEEEQGTIKM